jgi:hypothetical protein
VIYEAQGILRSLEIVMNVERIAEREAKPGENADHEGKHNAITVAGPETTKQNLILALKNLTEVWAFLYSTEQQKVVPMLTDKVVIGDDSIRKSCSFRIAKTQRESVCKNH